MRASWLIVALVPSALAYGSQSPSTAGGSTAPPGEGPPAASPAPAPAPAPTLEDGAYAPCAGKACGETCTICSPTATDCMETMVVKQCNAQGACVTDPVECPK